MATANFTTKPLVHVLLFDVDGHRGVQGGLASAGRNVLCVERSVNALLLGCCITQDVDTVYVDLLDS